MSSLTMHAFGRDGEIWHDFCTPEALHSTHCDCATPFLETGRENVDGPPHPARNQSPPQEDSINQEIQEVPPFTAVPVADVLKSIEIETLETINSFTLAPWETRMQTDVEAMPNSQTVSGGSMQVAVSSSARNGLEGFGVAIEKQPPRYQKLKPKTFSVTLGARSKQNLFCAELAAMAHTLNMLVELKDYRIRLLPSNKAAALTIRNP